MNIFMFGRILALKVQGMSRCAFKFVIPKIFVVAVREEISSFFIFNRPGSSSSVYG